MKSLKGKVRGGSVKWAKRLNRRVLFLDFENFRGPAAMKRNIII